MTAALRYPLTSRIGIVGLSARILRMSSEPDAPGMLSSVMTASNCSGSARNASIAFALEVKPTAEYPNSVSVVRRKPHQRLFVVDDHDPASCRSPRFALQALSGLARHGDIAGQRQVDLEHASLADGGRDVDGAAEPGHDAVHQRKAEAGPDTDFLGGEERIEDFFEDLRQGCRCLNPRRP